MKPIKQLVSRILLGTTLAAFLTMSYSCTHDSVMDAEETLTAVNLKSENAKKVKRPWKINSQGSFQAIGPSPDNCPEADKPIAILLQGDGNASHLGLYNVEIVWCTNIDADLGSPLNFIDGTLTAANGDQVYFESTSFNGPSVDYIVTGGTGRFEDASGMFNLATTGFSFDPVTGAGTYSNEGEGYIEY